MKKWAVLIGVVVFIASSAMTLAMGDQESHAEYETNSGIDSAVRTIGSVSRAAKAFRKKYGYLPGDLPNPQEVIPQCIKRRCRGGDGNLIIEQPLKQAGNTGFLGESEYFWDHLVASRLLPKESIRDVALGSGGGLFAFYYSGDEPLPFAYDSHKPKKGHYLVLTGNGQINAASYFLTASEAAAIDMKMDDGSPAGSVVAAGAQECVREYRDGDIYSDKLIYNQPIDTEKRKANGYKELCAFLYIKIAD